MPQENEKIKSVSELSFEDALAELEKITDEMDAGGLTLSEMTEKVERSMQLSAKCNQDLNNLEEKIRVLDNKSTDNPTWKNFTTPEVLSH